MRLISRRLHIPGKSASFASALPQDTILIPGRHVHHQRYHLERLNIYSIIPEKDLHNLQPETILASTVQPTQDVGVREVLPQAADRTRTTR